MISPLLTDLYQLTMAYGYWKLNIHEREAVFHQIFRRNPFRGNYTVACGLGTAIEFLQNWHFQEDEIEYLSELETPNKKPLFSADFLEYLKNLHFTCDIDAIPEGTIVFPHQPLLRITGPLLQAQLLESTLLNFVNFQSLIATKASRVCLAAKGDPVLEFGMRRAQGADGALSASRAAYIGGCIATSNVLAGKKYDIPVRGTHAHSWVTAFPDEISAFSAYAEVMPHNCVLLVDTFDTLQGVKNAIEIGKKLQNEGAELAGIRLDSGDMTKLSIEARKILDAAGFTKTKIIASNSLDEYVIQKMKADGAKIDVWGVGTNLVTSSDQPALDGVYKLSAIRDAEGRWQYKLKLSEQAIKISNPGRYQVRRFFKDDQLAMDILYDLELGISENPEMISLDEPHTSTQVNDYDGFVDLLEPIFRKGNYVYSNPSVHEIRKFAMQQVKSFVGSNPNKTFTVGLEKNFHELKKQLIESLGKIKKR